VAIFDYNRALGGVFDLQDTQDHPIYVMHLLTIIGHFGSMGLDMDNMVFFLLISYKLFL